MLEQLAQGFMTGPMVASEKPSASSTQADVPLTPATAERLKQIEARYRTLVEQIPAITFMATLSDDLDENEIYVSPHIEAMLGFTREEWLGDPFLWYRQLHPDDRQRWGQEFARACASGVRFRSECRFLSRDNREVWVHGEAWVVRDEQGRPLFLQGIAFDITESKRAEQALRRNAEELEQKVRQRTVDLEEASLRADLASRARASFLANMSHEIRTPLNGIIGFADLLRRKADSNEAERDEWLDIILAGGNHLLVLINDILDLSKIDAGKLTMEQVDCSPVQVIQEVCAILRPKAEGKRVHLRVALEGPLPKTIRSDPTRLRQVLINIAGNAIKFTSSGEVRITAGLRQSPEGASKLFVRVADTGIGIPADKLEAIFDPFTQADSSITRQFGGTGLGLAISRRLTERMGGGISVQSEVGKGTTFTCTFDAGPLEGVPLVEGFENTAAHNAQPLQNVSPPILNHRVLVVDDGETNRKLIRLVLGRAGVHVELAENGRQALERMASELFDLILMDMQMPVMDGYAATQELRQRGVKIPIIALTANAMKGDEARCRQAGCSGYLTKPIDQAALLATVTTALHTRWTAPSAAAEPQSPAERSGAASLTPTQGWLVSTLPTEDAEFREIVDEFVKRLALKFNAMRDALAAADLPELVNLAHWLKGTAGSAGFRDFTKPCERLEQLARQGQIPAIEGAIQQLEQIARRIVVE